MGMASTSPGYSQNPQSGYSPNPSTSDYGSTNHQNWLDTVVSYLTSKWAHGDHNLPLGWNSQQFGMPDPANTPATGTGQLPEATPATYLAFARYAQAYKPGMDPALDQVIPYIPPGPQDYIEDPAQVAARIANEHWTAEFGATKTQQDRAAWQQDFANQLSAYGYAQQNNQDANAFAQNLFGQNSANVGNANSLAGTLYGIQSGNTTNANNLAGNIFNTQSGTYNSNEGNKLGALQSAGGLANSLQQLWDQRTGKAIDLKANPQDLVAREYATRALQGPQATMVPGYSNVSQYQDIINKLMNWTPGQTPTAPTPGAYPGAPTPGAYPTQPSYTPMSTPIPTQVPFNTWMQNNGGAAPGQSGPFGGKPVTPTSGGISGGSMSGNWQPTVAGIPGGSSGKRPVTLDPNVKPDPSGYRWDSANGEWVDPGHGNAPYNPNIAAQEGGGVKLHAYGTQGTSEHQFIAGDPQRDGMVNPELVRILNPGPHTRATVTPMGGQHDLPRYAYGTNLGAMISSGIHSVGNGFDTPAANQGNIDTSNLPAVTNPDGSQSTVRTISINVDGREILIPTVLDGRVVSNEEAIQHYRETGQNLGSFPDVSSANAAAQKLHESESDRISQVPHYAYGTPLYSNQALAGGMDYSSPWSKKGPSLAYSQSQQSSGADYGGFEGGQITGGGSTSPAAPQYGQTPAQQYTPTHPLTAPSSAPQGNPYISAGSGINTTGPMKFTPSSPLTAPSSAPQVMPPANPYVDNSNAPGQPPQVYIPSYDDNAYQNYPSLQYAQGRMGQPQYNTLATGYAHGAFGAQIPEAGNLNYGHMMDIMNDPDAWGALQSLYASGNRNLLSAVAAAKARAPFGQAVNTSLVRT